MLDDTSIPSNFAKLRLSVVDTGIGMDKLIDEHGQLESEHNQLC